VPRGLLHFLHEVACGAGAPNCRLRPDDDKKRFREDKSKETIVYVHGSVHRINVCLLLTN
jgi:hypothetical protein